MFAGGPARVPVLCATTEIRTANKGRKNFCAYNPERVCASRERETETDTQTDRQRQRRDFDCASVLQGREGTNEEASRCGRDVDKDGREGIFVLWEGEGIVSSRTSSGFLSKLE
jgi:hypothetical protein